MSLTGKAWKFPDNVNTDVIIPARRCTTIDEKELARYCMEDIDPEFAGKVEPGDFIVAGGNFGCGSSREVAPICIRGTGVSAVIAASFARIFFRNAINIGLPILESPECAAETESGDVLEVDLDAGRIRNATKDRTYGVQPLPPFVREIKDAGGLMPYAIRKYGLKPAPSPK